MNKELIKIIDDNNVMYVGEHHFSDDWVSATANSYYLKNVVVVGYTNDLDGKVSVSLQPLVITEILADDDNGFISFKASKIKIVSKPSFTSDFIEKYNSIFVKG